MLDTLSFDSASLEYVAVHHQHWLFLVLVLFALLQEDVATATTALLAAHGHIPVQLGFGAILCGIFLGDLGLFTAGWFARGHRYALHILAKAKVRRVKRLVKNNLVPTIMITRCLPGMRLPTYFALGFFHADPVRFALIAIGAVSLWSAFLFGLSFVIGDHVLKAIEGPFFWVAIAAFIGIVIFVPRLIARRLPVMKELA
jgi:membrane protein DedA with SNARE-associated domain